MIIRIKDDFIFINTVYIFERKQWYFSVDLSEFVNFDECLVYYIYYPTFSEGLNFFMSYVTHEIEKLCKENKVLKERWGE